MQLLIIPALISVQSNIHLLQHLITHRANHSHLCSLHCRSVTTFDNLQHKAPHTTAVQFALINRKVPSTARCQDLSQAYQSTAKLKRMLRVLQMNLQYYFPIMNDERCIFKVLPQPCFIHHSGICCASCPVSCYTAKLCVNNKAPGLRKSLRTNLG